MIKRLQYYLTTILLIFMSLLSSGMAFAAGFEVDKTSFLNPPITDKSIDYLSQLFGTVGTVLHGTSGQLLSKIFELFNLGVLTIACVFAVYTVFKSVLATAQDGEFMGRQGKMWVPVRTCLGVGFLAPVFQGGYSAIQVLMMWVIVHGVGFADAAWSRALLYMQEGGQIYKPPQNNSVSKMLDNSAKFLQAAVCTYESKKMADYNNSHDNKEPENRSYTPGFDSKIKNQYNFPGGVKNSYAPDKCGSITLESQGGMKYTWNIIFTGTPDDDVGRNSAASRFFTFSGTSSTEEECGNAVTEVHKKLQRDGFVETVSRSILINNAYSACKQQVANNAREDAKKDGLKQMELNLLPIAENLASSKIEMPPSAANVENMLNNKVISGLIDSAADFINITLTTQSQSTNDDATKKFNAFYGDAISQGWITAGSFYYDLGKVQQAANPNIDKLLSFQQKTFKKENLEKELGFKNDEILVHAATVLENIPLGYLPGAKTVLDEINKSNQQEVGRRFTYIPSELKFLLNPINDMAITWERNMKDENQANPLIVIQNLGYENMLLATTIYTASLGAYTALGLMSSSIIGTGTNLGLSLGLIILPLVISLIGLLFASGVTMAIYVPMIPYVLFIFGALGWVITVVEAMVAAPLVALGVTHPDGHDLLGKSEQAVMLMLGVFLRPVLMVIGMLSGMILSYIGVRMINLSFRTLYASLWNDVWWFALLFLILIMQLIYTTIVVAMLNQAFSLIYHIPDKVLRWIGSTDSGLGKPEAIGKIEHATDSAGKHAIDQLERGGKEQGMRLAKKLSKQKGSTDATG